MDQSYPMLYYICSRLSGSVRSFALVCLCKVLCTLWPVSSCHHGQMPDRLSGPSAGELTASITFPYCWNTTDQMSWNLSTWHFDEQNYLRKLTIGRALGLQSSASPEAENTIARPLASLYLESYKPHATQAKAPQREGSNTLLASHTETSITG